LGSVRKIEGPVGPNRRVIALRTFVIGLAALAALPATALGASTAEIATSDDPVSEQPVTKLLVNSGPENNHLTVTLAGGTFTISDSAGTAAGPGCTQVGADVTCPATGIEHTEINLGAGDDTVIGSPIADIIFGDFGNDLIDSGRGGIDPTACLSSLDSVACTDRIDAGPGFDTITYANRTGPVQTDTRHNFGGDDDGTTESLVAIESIIGGFGADEIVGSQFADRLNGGPGNAADIICGGLGNDTVDYSDKTVPVNVSLAGQLASDPSIITFNPQARQDCRPINTTNGEPVAGQRDCVANDGDPAANGGLGEGDCVGDDVENIIGSPQDDVLVGNDPDPLYHLGPRVEPTGANRLQGGGGNDLLDGAVGPDIFEGGDGFDAVTYGGIPSLTQSRSEAVKASIDGAVNDGSSLDVNTSSGASDEINPDVEGIIGGDGNDVLEGDGDRNALVGGVGDDLLQGHAGGDDLSGGEGTDTLEGGEDGDALDGGPGDDFLNGGFGNDAIDGGDGTDTATWSDATTPVTVIPNGLADDGRVFEGDNVAGTVESLIGGIDNDTLVGNGGNGKIEGNGGDDLLDGGFGSDIILGGSGNDTAGYGDRIAPVNVSLAVPGGDGEVDENDDIAGDVEGIAGGRGADVLAGNGALNLINGGPGDDRISGAEGDDFLAGDLGNDVLNGDEGNDTLDGAEGNDTLNGAGGNDTLKGFLGTDVLDGGLGSDTMSGGDSIDTVSYASRSGDVTVDTLGTPNDGEKGENDLVRTDVESVRTGSGDDTIDISDGAAGAATCGAGTDSVTADALDEIGSGCEAGRIKQAALCVATSRTVNVKGGVIPVRLSCAFSAKGTLRLESKSRVKTGKGKARKLVLGSKSFTGKRNQITTVKVKPSKAALKVLRRKGRLSVRSQLRVRKDAANAAMRTTKTTFTVKASKKK
jgi:Ca2+-binding RTX toxin-like protein